MTDLCPGLPEAVAQWQAVRWPELEDAHARSLQALWPHTRLGLWSDRAIQVATQVVADADHTLDGMAVTPALVAAALPGPECWAVSNPSGLVGVGTNDGVTSLQGIGVLPCGGEVEGVYVLAVIGGEPWLGCPWRFGTSRGHTMALWEAAFGERGLDIVAVMLTVTLAGLLARAAGVVETVEVQHGDVEARWSCLAGELPVPDPRVKVS